MSWLEGGGGGSNGITRTGKVEAQPEHVTQSGMKYDARIEAYPAASGVPEVRRLPPSSFAYRHARFSRRFSGTVPGHSPYWICRNGTVFPSGRRMTFVFDDCASRSTAWSCCH